MTNDWAAENLQVIRTLMERSAIYRRALAPLMVVAGAGGIVTAAAARGREEHFVLIWMASCFVLQGLCLLLVRRQALREQEPFWTLPARRVTLAVLPGFLGGALAGLGLTVAEPSIWSRGVSPPFFLLAVLWLFCYGCALHAAGAFMKRTIRWFAWIVLCAAFLAGVFICLDPARATAPNANLLMGAVFGGLHLVFGAYLYLTEHRKSET